MVIENMFGRAVRLSVISAHLVRQVRSEGVLVFLTFFPEQAHASAQPKTVWNMKAGVASSGIHPHKSNSHRSIDCGEDAYFITKTTHTYGAGSFSFMNCGFNP
jgi:hypothetical protein